MALKQDQRAMLQLLLERGQSYDDIASLLGVERDAARARARAALTELAGQDPDSEVALSDYLLGQADPIDRADVARHLQQDDRARELASDLAMKLAAIAPDGEMPKIPRASGRRQAAARSAEQGSADGDRQAGIRSPNPSRRQTQIAALIAGAVAVVVAVALVVSGAFSGNGSDSALAGAEGESTTVAAGDGGDEVITTVPLEPQGDGTGSGDATFGVAAAEQPYLDLVVEGLDPAPNDETYVLWLLVDGNQGHPLAPLEIPESGNLNQRLPIDGSTVVIAAATREVDIALAKTDQLTRVIQRAADAGNAVVRFTGESVLRGQVPLADQIPPSDGQDQGGGGGANGGNSNGGGAGGSGGGTDGGGDGSGGE